MEFVKPLSPKEKRVMLLLATGLSNIHVAERCNITTGTVKTHRGRAFKKLRPLNIKTMLVKAQVSGQITYQDLEDVWIEVHGAVPQTEYKTKK